jgi:hypothetical protein
MKLNVVNVKNELITNQANEESSANKIIDSVSAPVHPLSVEVTSKIG